MIYVVNGFPMSGKSSFEYAVARLTGGTDVWVHILSTITPVKEIASKCGWNWTKSPRDRKFLSDLKDLLTDYSDFSFNWIKQSVKEIEFEFSQFGIDPARGCIFIDCREPHEIKRLCDEFNAKTVLVVRNSTEVEEYSNHADAEVGNYDYDIIINNSGTFDDLDKVAKDFIALENIGPIKVENNVN